MSCNAELFVLFIQKNWDKWKSILKINDVTTFLLCILHKFKKYKEKGCILQRNWYQRANLDIEVPIGYNIMIVKGTGFIGCEAVSDRLEREFYAE